MLGPDTYNSLALQGARLIDELYLLGAAPKNYASMGSEQYITKMLGKQFWENYLNVAAGKDPLVGDPKERVREADLIIIQIANNDICGYPFFMSGLDEYASADEIKDKIPDVIKLINQGLLNFEKYYPKLLKTIRSLNKTADIVLVGNYNPFDSVRIKGLCDPEVGNLVSTGVKTMNAKVRLWAKQYDGIYVDTFDLSETFPDRYLNDGFSFGGIHPTVEGHRWIAQRILNELPATEKKLLLPKNGEVRLTSDGINGGIYRLKNRGIFWSITDAGSGESISVRNGSIVRSQGDGLWMYLGEFCCFSSIKRDAAFGAKYLSFERRYLGVNGDGLALSRSKPCTTMYLYNAD